MTMTPANIHVGAGTLTLNPDSSPVSFESTQDGATLSYSAEIEPINVDQVLSPVGYFVPGEECTFEMMVVESDATTLQYALGATDQSVSKNTAPLRCIHSSLSCRFQVSFWEGWCWENPLPLRYCWPLI